MWSWYTETVLAFRKRGLRVADLVWFMAVIAHELINAKSAEPITKEALLKALGARIDVLARDGRIRALAIRCEVDAEINDILNTPEE